MQHSATNKVITTLVSIALLFTLSCANSKVHPIQSTLPQEKLRDIKIGDIVKVKTYSGEQYQFKVENISKEEIEGEGNTIPVAEIESIKKVRFTWKRFAAGVGIVALLVLLVWLGSNSESDGDRYVVGGSAR